MKPRNRNYLVLALFATLGLNMSWNIKSTDKIESRDFASTSQSQCSSTQMQVSEATANGKQSKTLRGIKCIPKIESRNEEHDITVSNSFEATIIKRKAYRNELRDFNTEAGVSIVTDDSLFSSIFGGATSSINENDIIDVFEIRYKKKGCNSCVSQSAVLDASQFSNTLDIKAALTKQLQGINEKEVLAAIEKKKELEERERIAEQLKNCATDGLKDKDNKDLRARCILERVAEITDKREAKRFWRKNKKHVSKLLTSKDSDLREEIQEELEYSMDGMHEDEDFLGIYESMNAMHKAAQTQDEILRYGQYYRAFRNNPFAKNTYTNLIDSSLLRFHGLEGSMYTSEGFHEYLTWKAQLESLGNSIIENPHVAGRYSHGESIFDRDRYNPRSLTGSVGYPTRSRVDNRRGFISNIPRPNVSIPTRPYTRNTVGRQFR